AARLEAHERAVPRGTTVGVALFASPSGTLAIVGHAPGSSDAGLRSAGQSKGDASVCTRCPPPRAAPADRTPSAAADKLRRTVVCGMAGGEPCLCAFGR